jgi:hypothetical protein
MGESPIKRWSNSSWRPRNKFVGCVKLEYNYCTWAEVYSKLFRPTMMVLVPDSSINSWDSWFIFNLRKINTNQYYELDSLDAVNCSTIREYTILQDDKFIIITVHT